MTQDNPDYDAQTGQEATLQELRALSPDAPHYAVDFVNLLLPAAARWRASDVHLQPSADGLELSVRLDGVLQPFGVFPLGGRTDIVTRLKVLASLLTYQTDLPQEGRIGATEKLPGMSAKDSAGVEMRVSTFPTLFGERAVVRLFARQGKLERLGDLGFPEDLLQWLRSILAQTSGMLLLTGPAGSGKTTTLYACLREIVATSDGRRAIVTMEDPIEAALPGVAQAQVNEAAGLTLAHGIRSLVRQDPEVLMIGEIRDPDTARAAMNASLAGHLVLSSFHAGDVDRAVQRLADMGVERYMLRNALQGVVNQRLARRLCHCSTAESSPLPPWAPATARRPGGCPECLGTGYRGRIPLAQWQARPALNERRIMDSVAGDEEDKTAPLWQAAIAAIACGATSIADVQRVLGG